MLGWQKDKKKSINTKTQLRFSLWIFPNSAYQTFLAVITFLLVFLFSTSIYASNQLTVNPSSASDLLGLEQGMDGESSDKADFLQTASYQDSGKDKDKDKDKDSDCDRNYWKKHCKHHKRLKIKRLRKLQFGRVIAIRQGAKVIIEPATGNKTVLQGIDVDGRYGPAEFEVRGQPNRRFVVTLPEESWLPGITRPGLRVTSYTAFFPPINKRSRRNSVDRNKSRRGIVGHLGRDGRATLLVGGTLNVRGSRHMGKYGGRFPIFVDYLPR